MDQQNPYVYVQHIYMRSFQFKEYNFVIHLPKHVLQHLAEAIKYYKVFLIPSISVFKKNTHFHRMSLTHLEDITIIYIRLVYMDSV